MPNRAHALRLGWATLHACGVALLSQQGAAENLPTLSGRWEATSMRVRWSVGQWGEACGPRPDGGGEAGGFVNIRQNGGELTVAGAGRPYSTTRCWEQRPGMSRISHSASARAWSTVCQSPAGDPRRATVKTTLTATDDTIRFDETGQFAYSLNGQNCTASSRRTRQFRLVERAHSEPTPLKTDTASLDEKVLAAVMPTTRPCAEPGSLARLTLTPARVMVRPGQEVNFDVEGRDAKGCRVGSLVLEYRLPEDVPGLTITDEGTLFIGEEAPSVQTAVSVAANGVEAECRLQIVSPTRFDALLAANRGTPVGTDRETTTAPAASVDAGIAIAEDKGRSRKYWFAGITALMASLLGGLGLVLMRSARRNEAPPSSGGALSSRPSHPAPVPPSDPVQAQPVASRAQRAVPRTLVSAQPGANVERRICPTCGSIYDDQAGFCGKDGSLLVPAN